ncbi:MAG TPA: hypothetical protein VJP76_02755 [Candidatus Tumulicola sp.]|nr:hypothetical protein [Candidatus Tumulicola sp.]
MPADEALVALTEHVGGFHITDRAMRRAQEEMRAALESGRGLDGPARERYLAAVRRYFDAFAREAKAHLRDVDQRLVNLNQLQFNLTAERGVAVKRIEATAAVLHEIDALEGKKPS